MVCTKLCTKIYKKKDIVQGGYHHPYECKHVVRTLIN